MNVVRFQAWHLADLTLQPAQAYFSEAILSPDYASMLESQAVAYTALDDKGRVLAISGIAERWPGHGTAYAMVSGDAGRHLVGIVKAIRGYLDHVAHWRRIEAAVDAGFVPGERMLRMLGFECEGLARAYTPSGGDCWIYARIRA